MLLTCLALAWLGVSFTDLPVLFSGQQPGLFSSAYQLFVFWKLRRSHFKKILSFRLLSFRSFLVSLFSPLSLAVEGDTIAAAHTIAGKSAAGL